MRFLVIAPQTATNSLGRALSLMEVLSRVGEARLAAYNTGPLWAGAEGTPFEVESFRSFEDLSALVRTLAETGPGPLVMVAVKPFPRTLGWAARLRGELNRSTQLIADIDDADLSIQKASRKASRKRQPPLRRLRRVAGEYRDPELHSPRNVRRTLHRSLPRADVLFVSSWALKAAIPTFRGPVLRLPHPRPRQHYLQPTVSPRLRLGFIGTPRDHKGFERLVNILAIRIDLELHVLEGTLLPPGVRGALRDRLVTHPLQGADTLSCAYAEVDVAVLPQDSATVGGRLQLPAKLLDAQRFGRPVIATATPPILELGGPGLLPVDGWKDLGEGLAALETLGSVGLREHLGRAANAYFNDTVSAESQAGVLGRTLGEIVGPESAIRALA